MSPKARIYEPRPEVLCARMAAFGLVEPQRQGIVLRSAGWECTPRLLSLNDKHAADPTSIYTSIRGSDGMAPSFRFKINALDPATRAIAIALVARAAQSAARSYGLTLPQVFVQAIRSMRQGTFAAGGVTLSIQTETDDERRHNVRLDIWE